MCVREVEALLAYISRCHAGPGVHRQGVVRASCRAVLWTYAAEALERVARTIERLVKSLKVQAVDDKKSTPVEKGKERRKS